MSSNQQQNPHKQFLVLDSFSARVPWLCGSLAARKVFLQLRRQTPGAARSTEPSSVRTGRDWSRLIDGRVDSDQFQHCDPQLRPPSALRPARAARSAVTVPLYERLFLRLRFTVHIWSITLDLSFVQSNDYPRGIEWTICKMPKRPARACFPHKLKPRRLVRTRNNQRWPPLPSSPL